ncbi:hypothetical protein DUNSADRAFT_10146 [Dunaliella salina]|uniref:Secreted protein n=1 Tax=Dunaliella salina TaxID=3046 RepID=A0ABQ7GG02_DUNSA|nr:hypothetical protein DUNSADRAFT_10146 [Dunaliella salina]|eukprot:KAF5833533.1 hypothetical protein DUNSADRAFT_10146 [Dunaliella salina]
MSVICSKLLAAVLSLMAPPFGQRAEGPSIGRGIKQIQGSILCDYGGAQAAGPYAYSNANRCVLPQGYRSLGIERTEKDLQPLQIWLHSLQILGSSATYKCPHACHENCS